MIAYRGQKRVGPRTDWSPLGVQFKISNEHPRPFHMEVPPGFSTTTSTGSGLFALLSRDFEQIFGHIVLKRVKTINNTNLVTLRHI